jgi:hypothetical protein
MFTAGFFTMLPPDRRCFGFFPWPTAPAPRHRWRRSLYDLGFRLLSWTLRRTRCQVTIMIIQIVSVPIRKFGA